MYDPGFDDADGALQITTPSSRRLVVLRHGLELLNLDETVGSKRTSLIDTNPPIGDVAATSTDVFVLQGTDLKRITLGTLANTTLATNLGNPVVYPLSAIAVDDTTVYFIEQHAEVESLRSVPIAGGQPTTLWTKTYWSGCTPSPRALDDIVGHSPSGQLVVDQGSVYWFGAEHFDRPALNGCGCSTTGCAGEVVVDLRTIAKTGGDATLLATMPQLGWAANPDGWTYYYNQSCVSLVSHAREAAPRSSGHDRPVDRDQHRPRRSDHDGDARCAATKMLRGPDRPEGFVRADLDVQQQPRGARFAGERGALHAPRWSARARSSRRVQVRAARPASATSPDQRGGG